MNERRARQRFPLRLRTQWRRWSGRPDQTWPGQTLNVSSSGLYMLTPERALKTGERVEISVWLPLSGRPEGKCLTGSGRVIRVEPRAAGEIGVAIAMDRLGWLRGEVDLTAA